MVAEVKPEQAAEISGELARGRFTEEMLQEMRSLNVCHNPIGKEGRQALQARFGDGLRVDWPAG